MPAPASFRAQSKLVPLQPVERDTIPKLFLRAVDRFNRPEALRSKVDGAWKSLSHADVEAQVARLAAALASVGIGDGDRVALLSENRPEWAIADYAITGMGAVDVPVYPTLPANQIAYILKDSGARAILVSTREQLAKILEIRDQLPDLLLTVAFDDPGNAPDVRSYASVMEEGQRYIAGGHAGSFRERALAVKPDDVATLIYTSGTTGDPKGVMLTHFNLMSNVAGSQQHGLSNVIMNGDRTLSFLPLSHVFERMVDYLYWDVGCAISYAESMEKVVDNMGEVKPNIAVSVPRLFEKIYTRVTGATGIKKKLVRWAVRVGGVVADARLAGKEPSGSMALQFRLADKLVFSKLRDRTGGGMRNFVSGGAPLSAEIAKFFFAAGLPVYEGYGLTETSPVIAVNKPDAVQLGSVGKVIPGVEVAITQEGEILTRGPHVMKGYWKRPDATAEVIDADGWFHTGDIGELTPEGFLRITDRLKNIIVTAGGKNVAPAPMENVALLSPYVAQVVMLGDRRPFTSLLVVPDWENLLPWTAAQGITDKSPATLCSEPRVVELLQKETVGRLGEFARYEVPKKVLVIADEFTIDAGLLTPSLKVKRKSVEEKYRAQIEALYSEADAD